MGAGYSIYSKPCKHCGHWELVGEFDITRNFNSMFPFWILHHQYKYYENDPERYYREKHEYLLKIISRTLKYYAGVGPYNHDHWKRKMKTTHEFKETHGWETNKYTVVMALIRYYWHLKRYPPNRFDWGCSY